MDNLPLIIVLGLAFSVSLAASKFSENTYKVYTAEEQRISAMQEAETAKPAEKKSTFFNNYNINELKNKYAKPNKIGAKTIIDVPVINQFPELPTGCEIASSTALLNYLGIEIDKVTLQENYFEDSYDFRYNENNQRIGPDPNEVFVGDPKDTGFGCLSPVVEKSLDNYFKTNGYNYDAIQLQDASQKDLETLLDNGVPVIVWASRNMSPFKYTPNNNWILETTGKKFTWPGNSHVLVLIGYDENDYYFSDCDNKNEIAFYRKADFILRWEQFNSQGIIVQMKD